MSLELDSQSPGGQVATWITSHDIAWRLADVLPCSLPSAIKDAIYVELGCRNYRRAVVEMLKYVVEEGIPLSDELSDDLALWLQTFGGGRIHSPTDA